MFYYCSNEAEKGASDSKSLIILKQWKMVGGSVEDVEFRIEINSPVALTLDSAAAAVSQSKPKWRLTRIELKQLGENVFECKVGIDMRDIARENHADLVAFRDLFLSLLALIAMVPVRPLIKGTFTFPLGENKFAQLSLGPMNYTFPGKPILSFRPLVEGFAFDEVYRTAVWFVWQGINSNESVHRFVNLAIAYELIIGEDSPVGGSRPPHCRACKTEITVCPTCGKELKLPLTLRERAEFMFSSPELLDGFIDLRNRIFHGGVSDVISKAPEALWKINTELLVNIRDYLGQKVGLKGINPSDIGPAVNLPEIIATVFFQTNE
jgi:hypothetical protein